ncbi:MAG: sigma 54-interacting transcriptional regulator, partial [Verrucomicrobia bacterium]|nr:sigma 54-interacting transcriptional regulator [Verrucomicrobiota bacterium]
LATVTSGRSFFVAWITSNELPGDCDAPTDLNTPRCLVIFQGLPVRTDCLEAWRDWAGNQKVIDLKMAFVKSDAGADELRELIMQRCSEWLKPISPPEKSEVRKGAWVDLTESPKKHDPSLLSMMFGSMGELLNGMDLISRRFRDVCSLDDDAKKKHKEAIRKMLKAGSGDPTTLPKLGVPIERLPRVLLLGETGVGKTLFAKYLAGAASDFKKVFIPEWLHKEDMLEYDLFGYARGAYTDGKGEGDIGKLLSVVGGVIFLDEIGTASPAIQAKLLGFMDDYRVEPRGWTSGSFKCPILVVAATNLPLEKLQDEHIFRPDLLARFTDIEYVPPLRERIADLHFILDCLLQNEAINLDAKITEIGCDAFKAVESHEFKGNFRELENVLRRACECAAREGRYYLCKSDLAL